jgi:hypothetical protein
MKRPARPEEIAPAFVFLAAPSCSSYITDEILPIIGRYGAAVAQAVVDLGEKGCRPPARTTGRWPGNDVPRALGETIRGFD